MQAACEMNTTIVAVVAAVVVAVVAAVSDGVILYEPRNCQTASGTCASL